MPLVKVAPTDYQRQVYQNSHTGCELDIQCSPNAAVAMSIVFNDYLANPF